MATITPIADRTLKVVLAHLVGTSASLRPSSHTFPRSSSSFFCSSIWAFRSLVCSMCFSRSSRLDSTETFITPTSMATEVRREKILSSLSFMFFSQVGGHRWSTQGLHAQCSPSTLHSGCWSEQAVSGLVSLANLRKEHE